jgi:hypothetical protein
MKGESKKYRIPYVVMRPMTDVNICVKVPFNSNPGSASTMGMNTAYDDKIIINARNRCRSNFRL